MSFYSAVFFSAGFADFVQSILLLPVFLFGLCLMFLLFLPPDEVC